MESYYAICNFFCDVRGMLRCRRCSGQPRRVSQCKNGHPTCYICATRHNRCSDCQNAICSNKCTALDNVAEIIKQEDVLEAIDQIMELFQCPICYERIVPPVKLCELGHLVCEMCWTKITFCPICNKRFTKNENKLLNLIIELIPYRCFFHSFGCQTYKTHSLIKDHELSCQDFWKKGLTVNERIVKLLTMFGITVLAAGLTFIVFSSRNTRR